MHGINSQFPFFWTNMFLWENWTNCKPGNSRCGDIPGSDVVIFWEACSLLGELKGGDYIMCSDESQLRNCSNVYSGQRVPLRSSHLNVGQRQMVSETWHPIFQSKDSAAVSLHFSHHLDGISCPSDRAKCPGKESGRRQGRETNIRADVLVIF